ncbi:MAG: large conductance mechanosensitive channel [Actinomycetota bacterium]|nr:large conductance mechanosensitive channel [Actinomycetota bacterium]HQZ85706.1 large conductance mechanosensitive channel protein MscL [Actinomycetota bacterium]
MLKGFRDFVLRGNVIDLAVAVVIGAAFTALVNSFTTNLIKPIVGLALGGGIDAGQVTVNGQVIDFTAMVNAIITFLITAAVVYFIFVVPMNKFRAKLGKTDAEEEAEEQVVLLREIRDLLADRDGHRS